MNTSDFPFLQNQSISETVEVLDEMLYLLVLNTDINGISPKLVHQYVVIRELRNYFQELRSREC